MSSLVVIFVVLLHEFLPTKVKQFVKVPKTYQNIFSTSPELLIKCRRVCLSEKARGKMAIK